MMENITYFLLHEISNIVVEAHFLILSQYTLMLPLLLALCLSFFVTYSPLYLFIFVAHQFIPHPIR